MEDKEEKLKSDILEVINRIRPYINRDGGEIELVDVIDGMVYVKMHGACVGCDMVHATVYDGLENLLLEYVPGVIGVVVVDQEEN